MASKKEGKIQQLEQTMASVMAVMAQQAAPLDLRDVWAAVGGNKKIVTIAVYRLIDGERLCFTTDRRVTLPDIDSFQ